MKIDDQKALETMSVFSLASVLSGWIFDFYYAPHFAGLFILIGLFVKPLAKMLSKAWLLFGETLGGIVNRLLLFVVYFTILTPMAFMYRLTKKDSQFFVKGANKKSYFIDRNTKYTKKDLLRPW